MIKLVVASCLVLAASAQFRSKDAKILKEQRFNAGDGRFGSAYAQEDGTISREETSADGERVGQYSYIDNDGKTITVRYTAGIDGFRILEGDHVPTGATGLESAAYDPEIAAQGALSPEPQQEQVAPKPSRARPVARARRPAARARAQPAREQPRAQPQQLNPRAPAKEFQQFQDFQPQQQQRQRQQPQQLQQNPFINPADPTHRDLKFNTNAAEFKGPQQPAQPAFQPQQQNIQQQPQQQQRFQPQQQQRFQQQQPQQSQQRQPEEFRSAEFLSSVPACAGCDDLSNFINPADPSHAALFQQPQQPARPAFQPRQQQFQPQQQQQQFFRQPQQDIQPAFLQQPQEQQQFQQPQQQQFQQPQQQQFKPQQQQFQPQQQQFQQSQFTPDQQKFLQMQQNQFQQRNNPQFQQPQQQQFQQPQQQQFQQQPQLSADELAHQRLGNQQIQEAVRLQNCLANPSAGGC